MTIFTEYPGWDIADDDDVIGNGANKYTVYLDNCDLETAELEVMANNEEEAKAHALAYAQKYPLRLVWEPYITYDWNITVLETYRS